MDELRARLQRLEGTRALEQPPAGRLVYGLGERPAYASPAEARGRALVLRCCCSLVEGFKLVRCSGAATASLPQLCEHLGKQLGLSAVERLEVLRAETGRFEPVAPNMSSLGDNAVVNVVANGEGTRPFPYTLHDAAADADVLETRRLLLSGKCSTFDGIGTAQVTPLHVASRCGAATELVEELLGPGNADVNGVDKLGRSALHFAATSGHADVAAALVSRAPRLLHGRTLNGATPLHEACYHGHPQVVDVLCRAPGVDINATDGAERAPLHWCALRGHLQAAVALIRHSLRLKHQLDPVNAADQHQRTPLHLACVGGHPELAQLLIDNRADVNAVDFIRATPMELAGQAHQVCAFPAFPYHS